MIEAPATRRGLLRSCRFGWRGTPDILLLLAVRNANPAAQGHPYIMENASPLATERTHVHVQGWP
jgi:hypothetical protein